MQIDLISWKMTSTEETSSGLRRQYELVLKHHGVKFDIHMTATCEFDGDTDDYGKPVDASAWYLHAHYLDLDGAIALAGDMTFREFLFEVEDLPGCVEDRIDAWEDWLNTEVEREAL